MIARCALLCAMAGCTADLTEVVIVTHTDLAIPFELDHVRYSIDARQAGGALEDRLVALDGPGAVALPLRLPIVRRSGDLGPIEVSAIGLDDNRPRIDRRARFDFVAGTSYELALDLMRDCVAVACRGDQTCTGGRCVPISIDGTARRDGGIDAGARDAGTSVADACPSSCGVCEASCDVACRCRRGCGCTLSCPSGASCQDVRCEEDSSCAVRGGDDGTLAAECRPSSTCEVHCG